MEWYEGGRALHIKTGDELERFDLGTVKLNHTIYNILTGYEPTGRCFWCGGVLKGKLQRYCYGHMIKYYRHFSWPSAVSWALDRASHGCENCGIKEIAVQVDSWYTRSNLEVHHIVPLNGKSRQFTAFNLPWNLAVLCHDCHQAIHAVMKPVKTKWAKNYDIFEYARSIGQEVMDFKN